MKKKKVQAAPVTLDDVAREAEVSLSTAARVLRSASYPVSPELSKRVKDVAHKIGYVPNLLARNLRGQKKNSLGLIVGNMREPFFGAIADFVTAEAYKRSLLAMVANMHRDPMLEIAMCRRLFEHRVDGLILAGGGFDQLAHFDELSELVQDLERAGVAIVSLAERNLPIPSFSADNHAIGRLLAEEALKFGHRDIGIVSGSPGSIVTQGRIKGLKEVLLSHGIKETIAHTEFSLEGAARATDMLLSANPKISIFLAATDTLGVGVMTRLKETGRKVPEDVSVISVGNTLYCDLSSPGLSSIDASIGSCCTAAIDYIVARWEGDTPPNPQPFPARLVRRDSLASVKKINLGARS